MNIVWRNSGKFNKNACGIFLPVAVSSFITYSYFGWIPAIIVILIAVIPFYLLGKYLDSPYCARHECEIESRTYDMYFEEHYCPKCEAEESCKQKHKEREVRISEYAEGARRAILEQDRDYA